MSIFQNINHTYTSNTERTVPFSFRNPYNWRIQAISTQAISMILCIAHITQSEYCHHLHQCHILYRNRFRCPLISNCHLPCCTHLWVPSLLSPLVSVFLSRGFPVLKWVHLLHSRRKLQIFSNAGQSGTQEGGGTILHIPYGSASGRMLAIQFSISWNSSTVG